MIKQVCGPRLQLCSSRRNLGGREESNREQRGQNQIPLALSTINVSFQALHKISSEVPDRAFAYPFRQFDKPHRAKGGSRGCATPSRSSYGFLLPILSDKPYRDGTMSSPGHSHSASSPSKPRPRMTLARSPSDPIPLSQPQTTTSPPQQIYVLSADGSSLFLLDPSKPSGNEEPPPYASHLARAIPFPQFAHRVNGNDLQIPEGAAGHVRHRASTMSALADGSGEAAGPSRPRPRYHSSLSDNGSSYLHPQQQGLRSVLSSPGAPTYAYVDETMPLLAAPRAAQPEDGTEVVRKPRGAWRAIFCGELGEDDRRLGFVAGWKRFWSPVRDGTFWWPILHLCLINFPFVRSLSP